MNWSKASFWSVVALLASVQGALMLTTAVDDSQVFDESIHLLTGYIYITQGRYSLDCEHPPLARALQALPLLTLRPNVPERILSWNIESAFRAAGVFLYRNTMSAEALLMRARGVTMLMTLGLGILIAVWTRRRFGDFAALVAHALYSLDPNIIAHGHYITTDLPATAGTFLAVAAAGRYLESGRRRDALWAGLALGVALSVKFSTWFLGPVLVLLWVLVRVMRLGKGNLAGVAAIGLVALAVVALVYVPGTVWYFQNPGTLSAGDDSELGKWLSQKGLPTSIPGHPFLASFYFVGGHSLRGHQAYLMGEMSMRGWWYYFPVAFLVKTPVFTLILLAGAAIALIWRREITLPLLLISIVPLIYILLSMTSSLNIGLRHILPIYPFVHVLCAAGLTAGGASWMRKLVLAGVCLVGVETLWAYPRYVGFFSRAVGGPENGHMYLLDSNLDWGQDLKRLTRWWESRGRPTLCLNYFGMADPAYYGLVWFNVQRGTQQIDFDRVNCVVVVSRNFLHRLYNSEFYGQLLDREPDYVIGSSLNVYEPRKVPIP